MVATVGRWLLESAHGRYAAMRRILDFLPRRAVWWALLLIAVVVEALCDSAAGAAFVGFFLWLFRIGADRGVLTKMNRLTVGIWEYLLWLDVIIVIGTLGAIAVGPLDAPFLAVSIGRIGYWVLVIYLYIDLFSPPRERKRVKVPALSKPPIPEFVT